MGRLAINTTIFVTTMKNDARHTTFQFVTVSLSGNLQISQFMGVRSQYNKTSNNIERPKKY